MIMSPSFRRLLPWGGAILLSLAVALGASEATRIALEYNYKDVLANEAIRRATEVTGKTLNGDIMGSVANLGLVNHAMKAVALGKMDFQDSAVMDSVRAVGKLYQASGVFIVGSDGVIRSSWDSGGKSSTGLDVKFRPYFQIAMQGSNNIYAAISLNTGQRALYFASPLYSDVSSSSPIIGAMVARLDLDRVDSVLKGWPGPALLFSPQEIVFASNRDEWVTQLAGARSPEQLQEIRALKQFGNTFDKGTPKILPFNIKNDIVSFNSRRYAVARAPVQWNDKHGEWSLTLLGDLDALMPIAIRVKLGAASGVVTMTLATLFLFWLRRLKSANEDRVRAEAELKEHAKKLESDSRIKLSLSRISVELQQSVSLADFARKFMFYVTDIIAVEYGVFYIFDEESRLLTPLVGHGVVADELEKITIGQGLVGQCAQDKAQIEISNSADSIVRIKWGAGEMVPQSIILLPVIEQGGELLGVIVMALLHRIDAEKRLFLDALLPMVAMNLAIQQSNLSTKSLLETSREQAEILRQQQGELQKFYTKSDEANKALQSRVEELAGTRSAMMNIMEDLEISRKETEKRNAETQHLLEESVQQLDELERFNRLTINREEKMIQLKEEINSLLEQAGKEKKYKIVE